MEGGQQLGRWNLTTKLGEGAFANVYLATSGSQQCVAKVINTQRDGVREIAQKEVRMLTRLKHPNIVRLMDTMTSPRRIVMVLELCSGGHLLGLVRGRGERPLSERQAFTVFRSVCAAVAYMHAQSPPIAHRDLKLENILRTERGDFKLCDFGSCWVGPQPLSTPEERAAAIMEFDQNTTLSYRAPEMIELFGVRVVDEKVDVWALGCVLYSLLFLIHPFQMGGKLASLSGKYSIPDVRNGPLTDAAALCLKRALTLKSAVRCSAEEMLERTNALIEGRAPNVAVVEVVETQRVKKGRGKKVRETKAEKRARAAAARAKAAAARQSSQSAQPQSRARARPRPTSKPAATAASAGLFDWADAAPAAPAPVAASAGFFGDADDWIDVGSSSGSASAAPAVAAAAGGADDWEDASSGNAVAASSRMADWEMVAEPAAVAQPGGFGFDGDDDWSVPAAAAAAAAAPPAAVEDDGFGFGDDDWSASAAPPVSSSAAADAFGFDGDDTFTTAPAPAAPTAAAAAADMWGDDDFGASAAAPTASSDGFGFDGDDAFGSVPSSASSSSNVPAADLFGFDAAPAVPSSSSSSSAVDAFGFDDGFGAAVAVPAPAPAPVAAAPAADLFSFDDTSAASSAPSIDLMGGDILGGSVGGGGSLMSMGGGGMLGGIGGMRQQQQQQQQMLGGLGGMRQQQMLGGMGGMQQQPPPRQQQQQPGDVMDMFASLDMSGGACEFALSGRGAAINRAHTPVCTSSHLWSLSRSLYLYLRFRSAACDCTVIDGLVGFAHLCAARQGLEREREVVERPSSARCVEEEEEEEESSSRCVCVFWFEILWDYDYNYNDRGTWATHWSCRFFYKRAFAYKC